ncbi:hypothetical protein [Moraxella cuniculi]|nr:hypothetical protein [Moraxella cuniculi]
MATICGGAILSPPNCAILYRDNNQPQTILAKPPNITRQKSGQPAG